MIPLFKVAMSNQVTDELAKVLSSGTITQGPQVEKFEKALQEYFQYPYILTVNSATSGLTLALKMLNLAPTDTILCAPLTCFATTSAVLANHYRIQWVDVDIHTYNISIEDCKAKMDANTKALCFVHWAGNPVPFYWIEHLIEYCRNTFGNTLHVIEDCAHAFGATRRYNLKTSKFIGTEGKTTAVYSLQAIKHLTTGDGGLMFLKNKTDYERAKLLRWYGISREQRFGGDARLEPNISEAGFKYHMNDINATIGLVNLPLAISNVEKHRRVARYYNEIFKEYTSMQISEGSTPSYWIYSLRVPNKESFTLYMTSRDISVSQVHKRNDLNTCVVSYQCPLPHLDFLETELVSIPCGWWLTQADIYKIGLAVVEWYKTWELYPRRARLSDMNAGLYELLKQDLYNLSDNRISFNEKGLDNVYVIQQDDRIICTGRYVLVPKIFDSIAYIEDIVTAPEYRNKGFATRMVETLVVRARTDRVYKVVLNCKTDLVPFYLKLGFEQEGVHMAIRFKG